MNTRTFEFRTLLADSLAVVEVSCEIDEDGDCVEFNHVKFNNFDIFEVISQNQWDDLEHDARVLYKDEQETQAEIDAENSL
jgi:hypothetical protein